MKSEVSVHIFQEPQSYNDTTIQAELLYSCVSPGSWSRAANLGAVGVYHWRM